MIRFIIFDSFFNSVAKMNPLQKAWLKVLTPLAYVINEKMAKRNGFQLFIFLIFISPFRPHWKNRSLLRHWAQRVWCPPNHQILRCLQQAIHLCPGLGAPQNVFHQVGSFSLLAYPPKQVIDRQRPLPDPTHEALEHLPNDGRALHARFHFLLWCQQPRNSVVPFPTLFDFVWFSKADKTDSATS